MPPFPSPRDSPCRLLLLDPHPLLRHGVQELLARQAGLQVDGSYGRSGDLLQRLQQQAAAIDLLLVDALPIGDSGEGLELLRHVSRHWPAVPILVLSAHCNAGVVSLALQAGARGFLSKACAPQMLLRAVSVVARGGRFVPPELRAQLNQSRRQRQQSMRSPRLSTRASALSCSGCCVAAAPARWHAAAGVRPAPSARRSERPTASWASATMASCSASAI